MQLPSLSCNLRNNVSGVIGWSRDLDDAKIWSFPICDGIWSTGTLAFSILHAVDTTIITLSLVQLKMASQRLAYSLRNATRVNKALNAVAPFRRYANPVTPARTESTTLSNGLTVCASIGIYAMELTRE